VKGGQNLLSGPHQRGEGDVCDERRRGKGGLPSPAKEQSFMGWNTRSLALPEGGGGGEQKGEAKTKSQITGPVEKSSWGGETLVVA